jgi:hypothetical protein
MQLNQGILSSRQMCFKAIGTMSPSACVCVCPTNETNKFWAMPQSQNECMYRVLIRSARCKVIMCIPIQNREKRVKQTGNRKAGLRCIAFTQSVDKNASKTEILKWNQIRRVLFISCEKYSGIYQSFI